MTTQEFSNIFDTLLNSYNTQAQFGEAASKQEIVLDEYEKSVLLTQAQDIIVKQYFDRTSNPQGQGFDDSTRRQMDFSNLVSVEKGVKFTGNRTTYDARGILYELPANVLVVLNEKMEVTTSGKKKLYVVVPINYKEYDRQMSRAYTQPLKKQCWRLFQSENSSVDVLSEIIPIEGTIDTNSTVEYKIRYIRRPRPIILVDLDTADDLDIDGVKTVSECELNPIVHMDILNKAFELALIYKGGMRPQAQQND